MYDEKLRFNKFLHKTLNLHHASNNSDFMLYLNIKNLKESKRYSKQIKVIINTGLYKKGNVSKKNLYEKELSITVSKFLMRQILFDPIISDFINFYIIIIKSSESIKSEILTCTMFAIRELLGKKVKILGCTSLSSINQTSYSIEINFNFQSNLNFFWIISVIIDLSVINILYIFSKGLVSLNFFISQIHYFGNIKWIINLKKEKLFLSE